MNLDDNLRQALARTEAPAGFAEKVLARVEKRRRTNSSRLWVAIAAAALIAVIVPAGWRHHETVKAAEEHQAGQQLAAALKIAGQKLHTAEQRIRRRTNGV